MKLTDNQRRIVRLLARNSTAYIERDAVSNVTLLRNVGRADPTVCVQTLRSLVRRGFLQHGYADGPFYFLTSAGIEEAKRC